MKYACSCLLAAVCLITADANEMLAAYGGGGRGRADGCQEGRPEVQGVQPLPQQPSAYRGILINPFSLIRTKCMPLGELDMCKGVYVCKLFQNFCRGELALSVHLASYVI